MKRQRGLISGSPATFMVDLGRGLRVVLSGKSSHMRLGGVCSPLPTCLLCDPSLPPAVSPLFPHSLASPATRCRCCRRCRRSSATSLAICHHPPPFLRLAPFPSVITMGDTNPRSNQLPGQFSFNTHFNINPNQQLNQMAQNHNLPGGLPNSDDSRLWSHLQETYNRTNANPQAVRNSPTILYTPRWSPPPHCSISQRL